MPVKVTAEVPRQFVEIEIDGGETVAVDWSAIGGQFRAEYRGQQFHAPTPKRIRERIEAARFEEKAKMARARALRRAEKNPLPAVLIPDLKEVGVRGIDKRSDKPLITVDGQRESVNRGLLLRPLTEEETAEVRAAIRARQDAQAATKASARPVSRYRALDGVDVKIEAVWDEVAEKFRATYSEREFEDATLYGLNKQVESWLILTLWPFAIGRDGNDRTNLYAQAREDFLVDIEQGTRVPNEWGEYGLFATREDAETHIRLVAAERAARQAETATLGKYALDLSLFDDETPAEG